MFEFLLQPTHLLLLTVIVLLVPAFVILRLLWKLGNMELAWEHHLTRQRVD